MAFWLPEALESSPVEVMLPPDTESLPAQSCTPVLPVISPPLTVTVPRCG